MADELSVHKQRLRQVLGALPCGYIYGEVIVDGDGTPEDYSVLDVNHAFSDITSITREKILGKRISGLFSISSVKDDIAFFSGVALSGDPVEREFFSPHFGNYLRVFCFSPEEGFFIALLTDLSREKKLEHRLDFVWQFCNTTSDEFYILDPTGKFILGNQAVADRLGIDQEDIPGHSLSELSTMMDDEWWNTLWRSLLQRGSLQFETEHRGGDNAVYPVELSVDLFEAGVRKYAVCVAKNISSKQVLSKALRQDRRFAEQAASMAGYFIWMIDSLGVFRPLLGGESGFVAGPVDDVFYSLIHIEDRNRLARAVRNETEGSREFRIKTERGAVYHRFKWSTVEDDCVVGICYPLGGSGLSGMGSDSRVMDAVCLITESVLEKVSRLSDALEDDNISTARRMDRYLVSEFSSISGKSDVPEKVRFDSFLEGIEGMLKQLLPHQPVIPLAVEASCKVVGLVDQTSLENVLVRLLLVIQNTNLATSISIRSSGDTHHAAIVVTVAGKDGIQAALEKLFIPVKNLTPGLASVYSMVRAGGGQVSYETLNNQVEFTLSFPRVETDSGSAFILIALPDTVDAARSCATLRSAGYSVAVEDNLSEILRRIGEEMAGVLIVSATMPEFSIEQIMSKVSGVSLIQVGGKPGSPATAYLPEGFRTGDLLKCVKEVVATTGTPQGGALQGGSLWGVSHLTPPLS